MAGWLGQFRQSVMWFTKHTPHTVVQSRACVQDWMFCRKNYRYFLPYDRWRDNLPPASLPFFSVTFSFIKKVFVLRVCITPMPVTQIFVSNLDVLMGTFLYVSLLDIAPQSHIFKIPQSQNQPPCPQCWCHHLSSHFLLLFSSFLGVKIWKLLMVCILYCSHQLCQYHTVNNWWSWHLSLEPREPRAYKHKSRHQKEILKSSAFSWAWFSFLGQ